MRPKLNDHGLLSRSDINMRTPAETAIANAVREVEAIGASVGLTEAVTLLEAARNKVADFVEQQECESQ